MSSSLGTREPAALEKNHEAPSTRFPQPWPTVAAVWEPADPEPLTSARVHHKGTRQHPRSLQGGRLDLRRPSPRAP